MLFSLPFYWHSDGSFMAPAFSNSIVIGRCWHINTFKNFFSSSSFMPLRGLSQRFFNAPATRESLSEHARVNIKSFAPLSSGHSLSFVGNKSTVASIVVLFFSGSPATILRRVIAIIDGTVERMRLAGFISQVSVKVFKRINPTITDGNATTAPTVVVFKRRVKAPLLHVKPSSVFRCIRAPVSGVPTISNQTPARLTTSRSENVSPDNSFSSTITDARPVCFGFCAGMERKNSKAPEFMTRKIVPEFVTHGRLQLCV